MMDCRNWILRKVRVQFGLRTLLVSSTLFAAVVGLVERKAIEQKRFKQTIFQLNGQFEQVQSFPWMPLFLERNLGEDRAMHVTSVRVIGYQAPNFEVGQQARAPYGLLSPSKLVQVLRMPGMKNVDELEIIGTAVTGEVIPSIRKLDKLTRLRLRSTLLTHDEIEHLRENMNDRLVDCSTLTHVTHSLEVDVPVEILPDLSIFSRARDGDAVAIGELIALSTEWNHPKMVKIISTILRSVQGREGRQIVLRGLQDESPIAQLTVLRGLTKQERSGCEFEILEQCILDHRPEVRRSALEYLVDRENDPRSADLLVTATHDSDAQLRADALKELEERNSSNSGVN